MLVMTFPVEGLEHPSDRSAAETVDGLVRGQSKRIADERVSGDMGLFVTGNICTCGAQTCVTEEAEDGEQYEKY